MRRLLPSLLVLLVAGCSVEDPATTVPEGPVVPKVTEEVSSTPAGKSAPARPSKAQKPPPKEAAPELAEQGRRASEAGDLDAASRAIERALEADPKNREALRLAVTVGQEHASKFPRPHSSPLYLAAAEHARALRAAYPELQENEKAAVSSAFYNEACTFAINGDPDAALKSLTETFKVSNQLVAQLEADPEFDSLRKLPAFQDLQVRVERAYAAKLMADFKPFPFSFALKDFEGKTVQSADLKGKIVLLDFWGTWCIPCRKQIPHLIKLHKTYQDRGFEVVGIDDEQQHTTDPREAVQRFLKENSVPYRCLIADAETEAKIPDFSDYPQFPTALVLDREGKVRLRLDGYQPFGALEAVVETLLKESPPPAAPAAPAKTK